MSPRRLTRRAFVAAGGATVMLLMSGPRLRARGSVDDRGTRADSSTMQTVDPHLFPGALAALIDGARTFRQREYLGNRDLMPRLVADQHPAVLLIGCSDSRVDPALICGAQPGDVFTIRNVANLVPAYVSGEDAANDGLGHGVRAALEYGVKALGVSHVVVFGHAHCGGVKAMIDTARGAPPAFEFIGPWLNMAAGVCDRVLAELAAEYGQNMDADDLPAHTALVERRSVLHSLDNLRTYPWIRERIEAGALTVHGWWFDLDDGRLWMTHPRTGAFLPFDTDS